MSGPKHEDARTASSQSQPSSTANTTTATEELSRFAQYVEFRTPNLRQSVAQYLGARKSSDNELHGNDDDEDEELFTEAGRSSGGWVSVADAAVDGPEDPMVGHLNQNRPPPPPAPGPIQQTTVATQRAALQALGLTGTYFEHGLRLVAEDVGWLTHTATFEDATRKLRARFPLLKRLGESYGRGARSEGMRRMVAERPSKVEVDVASAVAGEAGDGEWVNQKGKQKKKAVAQILGSEDVGKFRELVEVPLHGGEEGEYEDNGSETLAGQKA